MGFFYVMDKQSRVCWKLILSKDIVCSLFGRIIILIVFYDCNHQEKWPLCDICIQIGGNPFYIFFFNGTEEARFCLQFYAGLVLGGANFFRRKIKVILSTLCFSFSHLHYFNGKKITVCMDESFF